MNYAAFFLYARAPNGRFLSRNQRRYIVDVPNPVRDASSHRGGHAKCLVNAAEIIVHVVKRHGKSVVFELL